MSSSFGKDFGCSLAYRDHQGTVRCKGAKGEKCEDVKFENCKFYN